MNIYHINGLNMNMGKKFDEIFESVISVLNYGGYAPGNIVKFRPDYKSNPAYKSLPDYLRNDVDELAKGDLYIKVLQVGHNKSGDSAGNQYKTGDNVVLTVGADQGGGRVYDSITLPANVFEFVAKSTYDLPIPKVWEREDPTNFKPEEFKPDTKHITRQTNKGGGVGSKNTPTNLKLAGESTRMSQDSENMGLIYEDMVK